MAATHDPFLRDEWGGVVLRCPCKVLIGQNLVLGCSAFCNGEGSQFALKQSAAGAMLPSLHELATVGKMHHEIPDCCLSISVSQAWLQPSLGGCCVCMLFFPPAARGVFRFPEHRRVGPSLGGAAPFIQGAGESGRIGAVSSAILRITQKKGWRFAHSA